MAKIKRDAKDRSYRSHKDVLADEMKSRAFQNEYWDRRYVHEMALAVRSMRVSAGLSQAQLAELVGMKQPAIARLETSQTNKPQWQTINRIASALHKQLNLRLGEVEKGKPLISIRHGDSRSQSDRGTEL